MKFFALALLLSSFVYSLAIEHATLEARDASSILAAIKTIASDIKALKSSVSTFDGDLIQSLTILQQSNTLDDDIKKATDTTNSSPKLNNKDSSKVGLAFLNLEPSILSLLDVLIKKKPEFDKLLFGLGTQITLNSLEQQKTDSDALGAAVKSKLSKLYAQQAPAVIKKIDRKFNKAIHAYGG